MQGAPADCATSMEHLRRHGWILVDLLFDFLGSHQKARSWKRDWISINWNSIPHAEFLDGESQIPMETRAKLNHQRMALDNDTNNKVISGELPAFSHHLYTVVSLDYDAISSKQGTIIVVDLRSDGLVILKTIQSPGWNPNCYLLKFLVEAGQIHIFWLNPLVLLWNPHNPPLSGWSPHLWNLKGSNPPQTWQTAVPLSGLHLRLSNGPWDSGPAVSFLTHGNGVVRKTLEIDQEKWVFVFPTWDMLPTLANNKRIGYCNQETLV